MKKPEIGDKVRVWDEVRQMEHEGVVEWTGSMMFTYRTEGVEIPIFSSYINKWSKIDGDK